jgi:hypothetical protein
MMIDPTKKQMQFTMPFDWNMTRLEENNLMIHQEITIPKQSELASVAYVGRVIISAMASSHA